MQKANNFSIPDEDFMKKDLGSDGEGGLKEVERDGSVSRSSTKQRL